VLVDTPAAKKWSAILDDAESAALPMREFARSRGLNPNTLAWWKWRLKQSPSPPPERPRFVPILVASRPQLEVRVGAACIDVDDETDLALLKRVIQALE
jgi:hypothetical protein